MPVEELEDRVIITDPNDSTNRATILKFGATVVSWKTIIKKNCGYQKVLI